MHPVYISKIYKAETGENLSEYIVKVFKKHYGLTPQQYQQSR